MKYGGDPSRMFFVPHGPDYRDLDAISEEHIREVSHRYGLIDGRNRLIYCARMVDAKRPDLLIDAFARIANERPDWDLVMVGDGILKAEMESRVPEALRDRVLWLGFIDDPLEVFSLYRASDVFVLPSSFEPWAAVVPEAAGAGCAIVSSDVVGASGDLVRDGLNGFRFRSGDLEDLAAKLLDVTAAGETQRYRDGTISVIKEWKVSGDPVGNVRRAMVQSDLLEDASIPREARW
ncbi:MAG: glycosyltransferase family 4 protein [Planctomycetota bacterium]